MVLRSRDSVGSSFMSVPAASCAVALTGVMSVWASLRGMVVARLRVELVRFAVDIGLMVSSSLVAASPSSAGPSRALPSPAISSTPCRWRSLSTALSGPADSTSVDSSASWSLAKRRSAASAVRPLDPSLDTSLRSGSPSPGLECRGVGGTITFSTQSSKCS